MILRNKNSFCLQLACSYIYISFFTENDKIFMAKRDYNFCDKHDVLKLEENSLG